MSLIFTMIRREVLLALRRPMFWVFLVLSVVFPIFWFIGGVTIQGVSSGGLAESEKVHVNGPYQLCLYYIVIPFAVFTLFGLVAMASSQMRDRELRVQDVMRSTHLSPRGYLLGKMLGTGAWVVGVAMVSVLVALVADLITSNAAASGGMDDPLLYGAFDASFHLYAVGLFVLPWMVWILSGAFYLGERTRSPLVVYGALAAFYVGMNFIIGLETQGLNRWAQDTLGIEWKYVIGWVDPSGFSWLRAHYALEDRGVEFYNHILPATTTSLWINRAALLAMSLLFLWRTFARFGVERHGALRSVDEKPSVIQQHDLATAVALPSPKLARRGTAAGFLRVLRTELQVMLRQPAIWIFVPLIWMFSIPAALIVQKQGPFGAEVIITSNQASIMLCQSLAIWACGFAAFLVIEGFHRERVTRFHEIFAASPVSTASVILGKLLAVLLMMGFILASAGMITMAFHGALGQAKDWAKGYGEVLPLVYVRNLSVLLVPGVLFFIAVAGLFAAWFRSRLTAYAALFGFGILYSYALLTGWLDWRGRVIPTSLVAASDITGLRPYLEELVLNRVLVGSVIVCLFLLAGLLLRRGERGVIVRLTWSQLRQHRMGVAAFALFLITAIVAGGKLDRSMDRGPGGEWREDRTDEYALMNRQKWGVRFPRVPEYASMDFDLDLYPEQRRFAVDGKFTFENRTDEVFPVIPLTVGMDLELEPEGCIFLLQKSLIGGDEADSIEVAAEVRDRNGLFEVRLAEPLKPGDRVTLRFKYEGAVHPGSGKSSGGFGEWILPDAVFVDSFGPDLLPQPGYSEPESGNLDVLDDRATPAEMKAEFEGRQWALLGGLGTFDVKVRVSVPKDLTALSVGNRTAYEEDGDRAISTFESDHPVYFFPVMAGRYDRKEVGECAVYYHPGHPQNVDVIATALDQSRRFYSAVFSEFPWQNLRIVEFPQLAGFAMGHPTLIPFSESIGFLTNEEDGVSNLNFMVTAHEVAHQWWGNIVTPARAPGAPFLTEALAHYSTLLMEERFNGRVAARNRRSEFEQMYLRGRNKDVERPIVRIDGSEASDTPIWYNKGGLVFWMLSETMGRDQLVEALRTFIAEFSFQEDHPTIHDLLDHVRVQGGPEIEPFLQRWFYNVVVPGFELVDATTAPEGDGYVTTITIENVTEVKGEEGPASLGELPITVEVATRRRLTTEIGAQLEPGRLAHDNLQDPLGWLEELKPEEESDAPGTERDSNTVLAKSDSEEVKSFEAVREVITVAAGERQTFKVRTSFEPGSVLLDPDVQLLMYRRGAAKKTLK